MKISFVSGCPYEDYEGQILNLCVVLSESEELRIGETISIEMMDETFLEREVLLINPKCAGDYSVISKKAQLKVQSGEYGISSKHTEDVKGPCSAEIVVTDVPYHDIKTDERVTAAAKRGKEEKKKCLSPFKELKCGDKSIYDHVKEGYAVPNKVITYLRTTNPFVVSPGIYTHPFKPDMRLLGPYLYTDGKYFWDRDLWKYVVKYHVVLPEEFVDYVMSGKGDRFLEYMSASDLSWGKAFDDWDKDPHTHVYMPRDAGDIDIKDF